MKRRGGQRQKLSVFTSPPVSLEEPSPPDSVSRGGSAGVLIPQDGSFLAAASKETPWPAVSCCYSSGHVHRPPPPTPQLFLCCFSDPADWGPDSCPSMRRQALFRLLSTSGAAPLQSSSFSKSHTLCTSLVQTVMDLLPVEGELIPFLSQLVEVIGGLFHTVGGALQALLDSSHHQLQENLFGGNFLAKLASSNLTGLVGTQGPFVLDWPSGKGKSQENQDLVGSVSRVLGDQAFLLDLQAALAGHSSLLPPEQVNRKSVFG